MQNILNTSQKKQIAIEYGRTKGPAELAKEFGVSRQRIQQIASRFRKSGLNIPRFRESPFERIVNELKEEHPELFKNNEP